MSRIARRTLLKCAAVLSASQIAGTPALMAAGRERLRFIVDPRLPEAGHIAARAAMQGCAVADPKGEIIHLLMDPKQAWLTSQGSIIGLTGYSDLMLARDALRMAGRPLLYISALQGEQETVLLDRQASKAGRTIASLLASPDMQRLSSSTSFVWAA